MNHIDLLKQSLKITWRYRTLWLFGFFLALCSSGGGGNGNFNYSGNSSDFEDFGPVPGMPGIDPDMMVAVIVGAICLVILLIIVSVVVQTVARTAIIGMVRQISDTESVTVRDGLRLGWSRGAWRVFLVGLIIGLPVGIVAFILILVAFAPLLLLLTEEPALMVVSILLTILAVLFVIVILVIVGAIITPILELTWRRVVLDDRGVFAGISEVFGLIKRNLKDVFVIWLLLLGVGFGWFFVALIIVLPVSLLVAALVGGIPALIVYLLSGSVLGAAIAGIPLAVLGLTIVTSFCTGLYLVFRSSVWTLAYLELQPLGEDEGDTKAGDDSSQMEALPSETPPSETPPLEPQPEA